MVNEAYAKLLDNVRLNGCDERNARTGAVVRALPMQSLVVDLTESPGCIPLPSFRRFFPKTAAAELAWMLMGTKDVSWLQKYTKIWDQFTEPGTNEIAASYGHRWMRHFDRDQIAGVIGLLKSDPSSRQGVVFAWDPSDDGLGLRGSQKMNIPCPLGFTVNIIGDALHMDVYIRSSDIMVGLPYDYMTYAFLQAALANELGADSGVLAMRLSHAHIYECHSDYTEVISNLAWHESQVWMNTPGYTVEDIQAMPDSYVHGVRNTSRVATQHEYNPKLEVVL